MNEVCPRFFCGNYIELQSCNYGSTFSVPVRIRVKVDPPHPLVCSKRRLNGAVLQMRPEKARSRGTAGVAR
jgi:hypothetical protein